MQVHAPGQSRSFRPVLIPAIREGVSPGGKGTAASDLWLRGNLADSHSGQAETTGGGGGGSNGLPVVSGAGGG